MDGSLSDANKNFGFLIFSKSRIDGKVKKIFYYFDGTPLHGEEEWATVHFAYQPGHARKREEIS